MTDQHIADASLEVRYSGGVPSPDALAERTRRFGSWYFTEHMLVAARAWLSSTLMAAVGNPLVYLLAMGLGLGAAVSEGTGLVDGVSYLVFVAPALLVSTVVMSVMGEVTYPVMGGFTWNRTYYAAAASPLTPRQIALGHFWSVLLRFVWQGAVFYLIMVVFSASPSPWGWLLIGVGMLTAASVGGPVMALAASREDSMSPAFTLIQRFVIMPMFLFAGTFFPLEAMPIYLRWIGWVSPIWHGTQLGRVASYGALVPGWLLVVHVVFLLATAAAGVWAAVLVFERRLTT